MLTISKLVDSVIYFQLSVKYTGISAKLQSPEIGQDIPLARKGGW